MLFVVLAILNSGVSGEDLSQSIHKASSQYQEGFSAVKQKFQSLIQDEEIMRGKNCEAFSDLEALPANIDIELHIKLENKPSVVLGMQSSRSKGDFYFYSFNKLENGQLEFISFRENPSIEKINERTLTSLNNIKKSMALSSSVVCKRVMTHGGAKH